ncbi:diguanylate cyclase [Achromobacter ruhlandii]|uniref:diguanylate cyclase n=1 Tax=Achromobacter ruhlandii TaxID=72557 RepID=UPI00346459CB
MARVLQDTVRQGDLVCRLGGEEFVVVALDSDRKGTMQLAERLREAITHAGARRPRAGADPLHRDHRGVARLCRNVGAERHHAAGGCRAVSRQDVRTQWRGMSG